MRHVLLALTVLLFAPTISRAAEPGPVWPSTATGYGSTREAARKDALSDAVRRVTEYVRRLEPPLLDWQVTDEFVEKNLLAGEGKQGKDVLIGTNDSKTWVLTLRPPDIERFRQLDHQAMGTRLQQERQALARNRLLAAGEVFGGMAALLALTLAYLHWLDMPR